MADTIRIFKQSWPILGQFAISREIKTTADTVVVEIDKNGIVGRGECVPLKRYHHSQDSVINALKAIQDDILTMTRDDVQKVLPASPARNALDCALWDWEVQNSGKDWAGYLGLRNINPLQTAYTLSLDTPEEMALNAQQHQEFKIFKMKINGDGQDIERIHAVKDVAPHAKLILDANEAWQLDALDNTMGKLIDADVILIEQPLPEGADEALKDFSSPIPIAADETCHTAENLDALFGKYQVVNIKLDKTGGLTHAFELKKQAQKMGFGIMVGCMASTSLGILPALMVAQDAQFCDLDGAYLLEKDPYDLVTYKKGLVHNG